MYVHLLSRRVVPVVSVVDANAQRVALDLRLDLLLPVAHERGRANDQGGIRANQRLPMLFAPLVFLLFNLIWILQFAIFLDFL